MGSGVRSTDAGGDGGHGEDRPANVVRFPGHWVGLDGLVQIGPGADEDSDDGDSDDGDSRSGAEEFWSGDAGAVQPVDESPPRFGTHAVQDERPPARQSSRRPAVVAALAAIAVVTAVLILIPLLGIRGKSDPVRGVNRTRPNAHTGMNRTNHRELAAARRPATDAQKPARARRARKGRTAHDTTNHTPIRDAPRRAAAALPASDATVRPAVISRPRPSVSYAGGSVVGPGSSISSASGSISAGEGLPAPDAPPAP